MVIIKRPAFTQSYVPSDGEGYKANGSFLLGETDCGGNWVLGGNQKES